MSLLFRVIYAAQASSTHHKLALDALTYLSHPSALLWRDLFLKNHAVYLRGAKDPDVIFRDFRNHVVHVSENFWGGAAVTARGWYERTVELLAREQWEEAIYAAGVLSHYFTDPIMPFHTGQSKRETQIHRAAEWSVTKSYDDLMRYATTQGEIPKLKVPTTQDWLEEFIRRGAMLSHEYYQPLIEHYDFERGSKRPMEGWDDYAQKVLSQLLMYAAVAYSMVLDRAFYESKAVPVESDLTLETFLATISMPVNWITKKMEHLAEQSEVEAIYREIKETGKLVHNLPEERRVVKEWADKARSAVASNMTARKVGAARPIVSQTESTTLTAHRKSPPTPVRNELTPLNSVIPPLAAETQKVETKSISRQPSAPIAPAIHEPVSQLKPQRPTKTKQVPSQKEVDRQEEIDLLEAAREAVEEADANRWLDSSSPTPASQKRTSRESTQPASSVKLPAATTPSSEGKTFFLDLTSDLVDAPSIGPKTAARFYRIGAKSVSDFLNLDPKSTAHRLNTSHIKPDTIREWQDQARLVCQIPQLRGFHAQILVGCGYRTPFDVARANIDDLAVQAWDFSQTSAGQSVLRNSELPDIEKMQTWIDGARVARPLAA